MLTRTEYDMGTVITFRLHTETPVSVVGTFNEWTPCVNVLQPLDDGTAEVRVLVPAGRHAFRYLADGGHFFDEPDADAIEDNGIYGTHSVVDIEATQKEATPQKAAPSLKLLSA